MTSKNGYPYYDHCGAALVRFQWVDGYMVGDREYWYTTCLNCDKKTSALCKIYAIRWRCCGRGNLSAR